MYSQRNQCTIPDLNLVLALLTTLNSFKTHLLGVSCVHSAFPFDWYFTNDPLFRLLVFLTNGHNIWQWADSVRLFMES